MPDDVAVVIDYENLYYSVTQYYTGFPNLDQIIEAAEKYGRVASCQAFADWTQFQSSLSFLLRAGIQPIYCPAISTDPNQQHEKKSSVDPTICIHTMKLLFTCPNLGTIMLVSGDRDFIPLVLEARQMGRKVVVLGIGRSMSSDLAALADDVVLYRDIVEGLVPKEPTKDSRRTRRTDDPYLTLIRVIKEARKLGKPTTFGYLKLCMRDQIRGFDETKLEDNKGRSFKRFKDFIIEAVRREHVKLHTTGSANEVFLPDEDPAVSSCINKKSEDVKRTEVVRPRRTKTIKAYTIPSIDLVEAVEEFLKDEKRRVAFTRIKQNLIEKKQNGDLSYTHSEIAAALKGCINYNLFSGEKVRGVMIYSLVDDWRNKLEKLDTPEEATPKVEDETSSGPTDGKESASRVHTSKPSQTKRVYSSTPKRPRPSR